MLQKSEVASGRIFGEILKREAIDDSDNLSRATEVAYEFSVRRWGPSDLYTKTAPAALGIFDTFSKTTFATLPANSGSKRIFGHVMLRFAGEFGLTPVARTRLGSGVYAQPKAILAQNSK